MVKHLWPLLEISLSDFRRLAKLNIYAYLPNVGRNLSTKICKQFSMKMMSLVQTVAQPEEGGIGISRVAGLANIGHRVSGFL